MVLALEEDGQTALIDCSTSEVKRMLGESQGPTYPKGEGWAVREDFPSLHLPSRPTYQPFIWTKIKITESHRIIEF